MEAANLMITIKLLSIVCAVLLVTVVVQTFRIVILIKKVKRQKLKERLLIEIIEERCVPYGDDTFNQRTLGQSIGDCSNAEK